MAASHNDSYQLSQSPLYQNRIQAALLLYLASVESENGAANPWNIAWHRERTNFVNTILGSPTALGNYVNLFSCTSSTDAFVLSDATVGGTVPITAGNRDTQQVLVSDTHIDNAIASQFNSFIRIPQ
jgi:hypothetical protein